jgi:ubiquinone/menaquinone biosynthesis C-methylase UbiE
MGRSGNTRWQKEIMMSGESPASRGDTSEKPRYHHRGKFSEGLVNKELILKTLNIQAGQTILDAGCGNGYMSKAFSKKVGKSGKVYALDHDVNFIEVLRNETQGTNIEAIEADITKPTTLNQSSVDLIYLSTVIHTFSQQQMQGLLGEVKRLLKPNAVLAIVEIEKKETLLGPPLNHRFSPEELKDIVPLAFLNTLQVGEHFYMMIFKNTKKRESN